MHFEQELAIEFARNSIRFRVLRVHFWDSLWRCETREKYGCKRGRSSAVLVLAAGRSFAFRFDRPFTARRFSQITHKHQQQQQRPGDENESNLTHDGDDDCPAAASRILMATFRQNLSTWIVAMEPSAQNTPR